MKELVLDLSCELDEAEVNQRAQELSSAVVRRDEVAIEKGNVTKGYNERINALEGDIRQLSKVIRARAEFRPVTCAVMFHSPAVGTKRIVRKDTGEIVRDEAMSPVECQNNLFDAPEPASEPVQAELVEGALVDEGMRGAQEGVGERSAAERIREPRKKAATAAEQPNGFD